MPLTILAQIASSRTLSWQGHNLKFANLEVIRGMAGCHPFMNRALGVRMDWLDLLAVQGTEKRESQTGNTGQSQRQLGSRVLLRRGQSSLFRTLRLGGLCLSPLPRVTFLVGACIHQSRLAGNLTAETTQHGFSRRKIRVHGRFSWKDGRRSRNGRCPWCFLCHARQLP